MPSTYVHLSSRDMVRPMMELYGLENQDTTKESVLKPIQCWKCKTSNPTDASICTQCGVPLGIDPIVEVENARDQRFKTLEKEVLELRVLKEEMIASLAYIKSNWKPPVFVATSLE